MNQPIEQRKAAESRYAYYRRCQEFCKGGEQCKAPAEKGADVCYAHARQRTMAGRREAERRAVLAKAVAEMRKRGQPGFEMADLFTSFKGIQVITATTAQALIDGGIDGKTAGRLLWQLQTAGKILWLYHRTKARTTKETKGHEVALSKHSPAMEQKQQVILPQICADARRLNEDKHRLNEDERRLNEEDDLQEARLAEIVVMKRVEKTKVRCEWTNGPPTGVRAA